MDYRFARFTLGQTDSELLFYIFLSQLARRVEDIYHPGIRHDVVLDASQETINGVLAIVPMMALKIIACLF